jgi:type IX secretion system PorP/SprF family membrane protein
VRIIVLKSFLLIFLIFLFPGFIFGQDPEFSQFFANPLHLNPAFAGTSDLPRTTINYRNQWPNNGSTYKTYSISYDQISKKLNAGIGFQIYYDQELNNVVNTSSAAFSYSYHLKLNTLNFVTLGYRQEWY